MESCQADLIFCQLIPILLWVSVRSLGPKSAVKWIRDLAKCELCRPKWISSLEDSNGSMIEKWIGTFLGKAISQTDFQWQTLFKAFFFHVSDWELQNYLKEMVQFVAFGWSWLRWNLDGTLKTCPKTPANSPWCLTTRCTTLKTRTCGARTLRKFSDLIFSEGMFWLETDKIHWPLLAINVQLAILGPELNCYVKSNPENRRDTKGTWRIHIDDI